MRVLIATGLYPPEIGGPATYSSTLKRELPKRGIDITVLPFRRVRHLPKLIRHMAYFFLVVREGKTADLIYAMDPVSVGLPAYFGALVLGKKFILKMVGDYAWEQAAQRFGFRGILEEFQHAKVAFVPSVLRSIERMVARRALHVVVPSRYLGKVVHEWGVPKEKITVIYNGMEPLEDTGNKPVLRGLLKFHGKLLISVGRLVPWKGFKELIGIAAHLKKDFPDLKLMIVGSGPELAALEKTASEKGLGEDVIFTGALARDVLLRYIRASDVFILNTRYEGFSHQIIEVMMVGVPIIATKIGGNPEAIDHERNGFLVAPNDVSRIEGYTKALLTDASLRMRITAAAKRKVQQFSTERMVEETAAFLKNI
ncbi:MAG: glycosyltransferase family 4 protein [Patescibacteria group bacterium]|nr:glycosyltransferase family 4 protein [Patescibacteria group bacterium]